MNCYRLECGSAAEAGCCLTSMHAQAVHNSNDFPCSHPASFSISLVACCRACCVKIKGDICLQGCCCSIAKRGGENCCMPDIIQDAV